MSRELDATKHCWMCGGRSDRGSRARAPGRRGEPWTTEACAHAEGDRHRRQVILTEEAHEGRFLAAGDHVWRRNRAHAPVPATLISRWCTPIRGYCANLQPVPGRLLAAGVSGLSSMLDAAEVEELLPALELELEPWASGWAVACLHASVDAVAFVRERNVPWWRAIRAVAAQAPHGRHLLEALPRWVVA